MTSSYRVLPILQSPCAAIDELSIEEIGPFGKGVTEATHAKWVATGSKVRTSDVEQ